MSIMDWTQTIKLASVYLLHVISRPRENDNNLIYSYHIAHTMYLYNFSILLF